MNDSPEFPTRPTHTGARRGHPFRARPCGCGDRQRLIDDNCLVCGRMAAEVIDGTFRNQTRRTVDDGPRLEAVHTDGHIAVEVQWPNRIADGVALANTLGRAA